MTFVFVHGRGQGNQSSEIILSNWRRALEEGYRRAGFDPLTMPATVAPFYGARLDELTRAADRKGRYEVVFRGRAREDEELAAFARAILDRMAENAGVSDDDIRAQYEPSVVDRGPLNWEWSQAILRALSSKVPWLAETIVLQFIDDVWAYLTRRTVRRAIDDIVLASVPRKPCVVIAHSLGTIVAYNVLAANSRLDVRLFMTVGSPLGIESVKQKIHRPLGVPGCVKRWVNIADEEDVVALYSTLDRKSFAAGIENLTDIENEDEPHSIERYLKDPEVVKRVATTHLA